MSNNKIRICRKCEEEYTLFPKKAGYIDTCHACGLEDEKGMSLIGGTMRFDHKTAPVIDILPMKSAINHIRVASRSGKKSNLGKNSYGTEVNSK